MKRTLIISGGNIDIDLALSVLKEKFDEIIAVDAGLGFCRKHGIVPTRIVGDFDTLSHDILDWYKANTNISIREYNPVKDATDSQIAVELAMELQSTDIVFLGATGTRLDHVLGNIYTLYLPFERGIRCTILDKNNRIRLISGEFVLKKEEQYGKYFSLIPFTQEVKGVTIIGADYPLDGFDFSIFTSAGRGVSNEIAEEEVRIRIEEGIMILIESKD